MVKQLVCVTFIATLGAACTQQSPQPPYGQDAAATGTAGTSSGSTTTPARPGGSAIASATSAAGKPAAPRVMFKEMTIPTGTALSVTLDTAVGSDTSKIEDPVRGKLSQAIVIDGATVVPYGSQIFGTVTEAKGSGKVQGRGLVAFKFDKLDVRSERLDISTARYSRQAATTKTKDAEKVGIGAGAGAVIGAIAGGGKGAAIGTAVGAGAGTGVVMATKGDEVRLAPGAVVSIRLNEPVKVLVPID